ncbi:ephrin type-A receptor 4a-like [Saccostrea echinata]|uniref:ephrin type-A receptor 4a-like n=1 Tax=Saccostrea echinata TaxID=191078 RepID=UPI002A7EB60B|nr:ephrin type-A receptor 4a-like [Saccostrea echinata]
MQYLESRKIVHRDLGARNVPLDRALTAKVSDFGLARLLDPEDSTYASSGGPIPVKWTAPEGLARNFSSKSDVWSYGIVLIEIVTRGEDPYPDVSNSPLQRKLREGYRHPQPRNCSDALYQLMLSRWNSEPSNRSNFLTIARKLADINVEK